MKHSFKQRIIYADTDAEGVVYYANYLKFFERGRMEFLRELGILLKDLKEKKSMGFTVTRVECDYMAPASLDEEITINTEVVEKTGATVAFYQQALRGERVLVSAKITVCAISLKSFRPMRIPEGLF
ncbi:MAG: YbgC/FadM family acyl-CoA thioesterase [Candidatus Margulisiibacteriota bacterium]|nr:YbgC/FadM family acyl-CoA thioesterase [Candidatus Margulisiibacteriota bacterium]